MVTAARLGEYLLLWNLNSFGIYLFIIGSSVFVIKMEQFVVVQTKTDVNRCLEGSNFLLPMAENREFVCTLSILQCIEFIFFGRFYNFFRLFQQLPVNTLVHTFFIPDSLRMSSLDVDGFLYYKKFVENFLMTRAGL